ncbi:hypothetical protein BV365_04306 [Pseudomonas syringae pv. actinidiae]|nr:hypothetical protein [Pseudomonas syringae]OSO55113.1 hypothetical protein BV365_04306 [Pseudomonas syringae pv. actinidiae]
MQLSLFYFADAATEKKPTGNTYQLLMDGARSAFFKVVVASTV